MLNTHKNKIFVYLNGFCKNKKFKIMYFNNLLLNFFLLLTNSFIIHNYFGLLAKLENLENDCKLIKITLETLTIPVTHHNDLYLYGSLGILALLFVFYVNNEFFLLNQKMDFYQNDLLKNLEDIISNEISPQQTEHLFGQLLNILLNQNSIMRTLETISNKPFQVDPTIIEYADVLTKVCNQTFL